MPHAESSLRVRGTTKPLAGSVVVPGDKSVSHRAVLFGALCDGRVRVDGLSGGEDNRRTVEILQALGVVIHVLGDGALEIEGVGLDGLSAPTRDLDCGNSGTSMRLCAGLLAPQRFSSRLVGDHYLHRRPMKRVIDPLTRMGARLSGQPGAKAGEQYPPLAIEPAAARLSGLDYVSQVASAQVKSAILIAGMWAEGATRVTEPEQSRDHTERMLRYLGAPLNVSADGRTATFDARGWDRRLAPRPLRVPGDLSSAAFVLGAAAISRGARVTVRDVGVNPSRTGILDVLAAMGAEISRDDAGDAYSEPVAALTVRGDTLRATTISGELTVRAIDELPLIAALAACAEGDTTIRDAAELRVKESDRIVATAAMLRAFGVEVEELPDGMIVRGGATLRPGIVESHGDHRIAMAGAVLASGVEGETLIRDTANVATSFPTFATVMRAVGVDL